MSKLDDAIMYHNEARLEFESSYALKPKLAHVGLVQQTQFIDRTFKEPQSNSKYVTALFNPPTGFSHVGAGVQNNYQHKSSDPRFRNPVYGNSKPQLLSYSTKNSNLLFN